MSVRHAWNEANQGEGFNRGETRSLRLVNFKLRLTRLLFNEQGSRDVANIQPPAADAFSPDDETFSADP